MSTPISPKTAIVAGATLPTASGASAAASSGVFRRAVAALSDPQKLFYSPLQSLLEYAPLGEKVCSAISRTFVGTVNILGTAYLCYRSLYKKNIAINEQQEQYKTTREELKPRDEDLRTRIENAEVGKYYKNHATIVELNKDCKNFFEDCESEKKELNEKVAQNPTYKSLLGATPLLASVYCLSSIFGIIPASLACLGLGALTIVQNLRENYLTAGQFDFVCKLQSGIREDVYGQVSKSGTRNTIMNTLFGPNYKCVDIPDAIKVEELAEPPRKASDIDVDLKFITDRVEQSIAMREATRQTKCSHIKSSIQHTLFKEVQSGKIESPSKLVTRRNELLTEAINSLNKEIRGLIPSFGRLGSSSKSTLRI